MSESKKSYKSDHREYVNILLEKSGESVDWEVYVCPQNFLQLDYDQPFPFYPPQFFDVMGMLVERCAFATALTNKQVEHRVYSSRSGNTHYLIELPGDMSDYERTAWQAAFGSDPKREAGHLLSLMRHEINPILLIMRKDR